MFTAALLIRASNRKQWMNKQTNYEMFILRNAIYLKKKIFFLALA